MKKKLLYWAAVVGISAAFTSCAYDSYYSGGSYSTGYSSGYGNGYGYGGSGFSTSLFVSTGDPRWGYDPSCYSYYDYTRRSYYDPYLYGYYPVGYRPRAVYGCPHPYGWRQGSRYCSPPRNVRNVTVVNYHDRERAYRNSNHSWSNQVRYAPESHRSNDYRGNQYDSNSSRSNSRAPSWNASQSGRPSGNYYNQESPNNRGDQTPDRSQPYKGGKKREAQLPPSYNAPVTSMPRNESSNQQRRSIHGPSYQNRLQNSQQAQEFQKRDNPQMREQNPQNFQRQAPQMREKTPQNFQRQAPQREERRDAQPQNSERGNNEPSSSGRKGMRSLGDG